MLFVNFLKKNAEAGQAFFKKLLLVFIYYILQQWRKGRGVPNGDGSDSTFTFTSDFLFDILYIVYPSVTRALSCIVTFHVGRCNIKYSPIHSTSLEMSSFLARSNVWYYIK